jgi:NADH:ubiquinone oxidoreductase subunit F (NADH-binding)
MGGTTLCALADAAVGPLRSLVQNFPDEVAAWLESEGAATPVRRYFEEVTA